jgi:ubiquinone/menaquinone biosynthesis C-methylase UbiE
MLHPKSQVLQDKYKVTSLFYDLLDYPWERQYKQWRPKLLEDISGSVLEAGVGTGRNLKYYNENVQLTAIDLSPEMLQIATRRAKSAKCQIQLETMDASNLVAIEENTFDWLVSTFLCCVMPNELQPKAIDEFVRVLRPGGRFKLLEMVYSSNPKKKRFQKMIAPLVEKIYGARFDRKTLAILKEHPKIELTHTSFLKDDTYLLIEGTIKD